ncbi:hypothetical protein TIFTF001_000733 [Ficus carica]|uniref:Uncharacterized protein n=1 Tax=Ficus carica TaxID=3494 RepID=A0AA87YYF9_FICCA|nr:hypothetical protein TIFTF001_000733 [Ficus carica]
MARLAFIDVTLSIFVIFTIMIISFPLLSHPISSCNGGCRDLNDCEGQLICINGRCNDDSDLGTRICKRTPSPAPGGGGGGGGCDQYGALTCNGGPSECDDRYHDNSELIVALSTGWFDNRWRGA